MLKRALPIFTKRLLLRPFAENDAAALYHLHSDAEVTRFAGGLKTRAESLASLERLVERGRKTGFCALAVEELASGLVIGWCGLQQMRDSTRFEIIYALSRDRWGHGFALEAASAVIGEGFRLRDPRLAEIFGLVFAENQRSIRVLKKLGMQFMEENTDDASQRVTHLYRLERGTFFEQWRTVGAL